MNVKHGDGNSDGIIDKKDTLAIHQNYGKTHTFPCVPLIPDSLQNTIEDSPLKLTPKIIAYPMEENDYTLTVGIYIEAESIGNEVDAYGMAYELDYFVGSNTPANDVLTSEMWNNPQVEFSTSSMGVEGVDLLTLAHYDMIENNVDVALTNINHQDGNNLYLVNMFNLALRISNIATVDTLTGGFNVNIPNDSLYIALSQVQTTSCSGTTSPFEEAEQAYTVLPVQGDTLSIDLGELICNFQSPAIETHHSSLDCGNSDGSIGVTMSDSPAPYTVMWENSFGVMDSFTVDTTEFIIANLAATDYDLTVTDVNGCSVMTTFQIEPDISPNCDYCIVNTPDFKNIYSGAEDYVVSKVVPTSDKGWILVGYTQTKTVGKEVFVLKLDSKSKIEWSKEYGGLEDDVGRDIVMDKNGRAYSIVGYTDSFSAGEKNAFFLKIDTKGKVLNSEVFGGEKIEEANHLMQISQSEFIITGISSTYGMGDFDNFIIKTEENGELIWSSVYGNEQSNIAYKTIENKNGTLTTIGTTYNKFTNTLDISLINLEKDGTLLSSKTIENSKFDNIGVDIMRMKDGGVMIAGQVNS